MEDAIQGINTLIESVYFRVGFSQDGIHSPTLQFKLTNYKSDTEGCFEVNSSEEAEDIVISFITTAQKGSIFTNDVYSEDKDLFLRVNVVLPEPS
ncbi:hypothetical protein SL057_002437 [Flavobacterium psychrophilum]|nr:hypothetical protein [Flavobacterium psychrophilum]ELY2011367.1 hypothetical protein [Flavobacterium psychrophilum]